MADFADISAAREELDRSLALKVRAPKAQQQRASA